MFQECYYYGISIAVVQYYCFTLNNQVGVSPKVHTTKYENPSSDETEKLTDSRLSYAHHFTSLLSFIQAVYLRAQYESIERSSLKSSTTH